jgi:predicted transposase YbfD/YdcC
LKTIAELKKTRNIEVVLQVKGNQKKLLEKCTSLSNTVPPHSKTTTVGKRKRGRIEKRTVTMFHINEYDLGDTWNDSIQTLIKVERETNTFNTVEKKFFESFDTALYISTTNTLSAKKFAKVIRSHWGIENSNHYVRDVSLHEDFSRVRKNPENVATLRSFALNLLRVNGEKNISQAGLKKETGV